MDVCKYIVFLCVLAASFRVSAQNESKVQKLIEQANSKHAELEFEQALDLLTNAIDEKGNTREELIRIYHLMGLLYSYLGNNKGAEGAFARLLALDPGYRLDTNVAPKVTQIFQKILNKNIKPIQVRRPNPSFIERGDTLEFIIKVDSNPSQMIHDFVVWFRLGAKGQFNSSRIPIKSEGNFKIPIPAPIWQGLQTKKNPAKTLYWYAIVEGDNRSHLIDFGSPNQTYQIEVIEKNAQKGIREIAQIEETSWYNKWWVWAIIGGVAAAGATSIVLLSSPDNSGPFDFTIKYP